MSSRTTQHGPTALVVNDTPEVLELLTLLLTHEGYQVVSANNGLSALEMARRDEPDIVISDVVMPQMDGLEFCRRLKQDARTSDVPVLLVSAVRTADEDSLTGLVAGADDYLEIPFRRQELLVKVARLTERHRVERHYREIVEQAADIIYTRDMEGRITSINEAGARFFGRTAQELIGVSIVELLGEEVKTDSADSLTASSLEPLRSLYYLKDAEGVPRYLEAIGTAMRDSTGQPTGVRSVVRDITERKQAEEALRESEERYREMFEKNQAIKLLIEPESLAIVDANPAACEFYGYSLEEFKQKKITDINTLTRREAEAEMERILSERRNYFNFRHRLASGEVRDVEVHASPIQAKGRRLVYSIIHDITERSHAEEALRESEEKFRAQYKGLPLPTYSWRKTGDDDFILVDYNDAALEITKGYVKRVIGSRVSEFYRDRPDILEDFRRCLNEQGVVRREMEYRFQGTGETRFLDTSYVHVPPDLVMVHTEDITERKRAEERLRESEEKFRSIVEATNEWIWSIDIDGRHTYTNPAVEAILGYTPEEMLGRMSVDFLHEEDRRRVEEMTPRLIAEKRGWSGLVLRWRHKNGSYRYLESSGVPILDSNGELIGYRGTDRDITERKQTEEALTELAEREALINRISKAVHRSLGLAEIFRTAVHELGSHLSVDRCLLFMLDQQAGLVRTVAEYRAPGVRSASRDYSFSLVEDLIAGIREHGVLAFDDAAGDERISRHYNDILRAVGIRSVMYVPIKVGSETTGCFALSTTRSLRSWNETDVALARAVADQTGIAIRQAQLYQKAEATSARQALINRLSLAIRASLSMPEVLSTATHELGRALSASRVHIHLYDPANIVSALEHEYVAPHSKSVKHMAASYDDPVGQRLLRTQEPLIVDDALNYTGGTPAFSAYVRQQASLAGLRSQIAYPLIVNEQFRGALCIHQTDRVRHWMEDELALVEAVAAQLATGIAQAELFELTRRAKKEWETTFDAMSDGIFIFDNTGKLIRVNSAGASMEDTWPHLLLGRQCCDILRESADDSTCIVERSISEGRSVTTEITPARFNRPLLVTVEPITEAGSGNVGAVCTARDLSELRKAEAMAREHQSLLTNILESVREPICAIDPTGHFMWCNSATHTAGGYRPDDLLGHHFLELIYPADRETAHNYFESALKGETQSYEVRYHTRDGEVRYALFDNAPLVMDERITGVLGIMRDITEQKQQRQRAAQADKLRALGQLASGVAHDFNNALAAVLGRAQLMRRQIKDEAIERNLDIIQTAAEDAAATVRRIQTFARQSQTTELEKLNVSNLLRDAIEITRTRWENEARMRGLHYEVELSDEPEAYVSGNASELREVFVNLIVNAVDAMPFGGRLSIACEQSDAHWRLSFTDTGTGMTEDVRERIFEPFYTTKGAQGTGLGLSVSYGIIERHGGSISVESEVGHGSTFSIDLPATRKSQARVEELQVQADIAPLSILVVDDEQIVRETLSEMLEAMDHRVTSVGSGPEAIERLKRGERFDLVFTDLSMPDMDGWEVAREIRRRWPEVAITLVTGYGKGTEPPSGEKNLIDGVIGKPFDFAQVIETIAQLPKTVTRDK